MENLIIPQHIMLKLKAWRDFGSTEVTGFFISDKNNILKIIDAHLVKADCTGATVYMSPQNIGDFYNRQIKQKIYPDQLMIWWHTHPGNSAHPSSTDEQTFNDLGKDRTFNAMYILARGGDEFAQFSVTDKTTQKMLKEKMTITHPVEPWINMPDYAMLKTEYDEMVQKLATHHHVSGIYNPNNFTNNLNKYSNQDMFINHKNKRTQREIWETNQAKTPKNDHVVEDIIFDELNEEFTERKNIDSFLNITQHMIQENEISEEKLNKWFIKNKLHARCNGGIVG